MVSTKTSEAPLFFSSRAHSLTVLPVVYTSSTKSIFPLTGELTTKALLTLRVLSLSPSLFCSGISFIFIKPVKSSLPRPRHSSSATSLDWLYPRFVSLRLVRGTKVTKSMSSAISETALDINLAR